MMVVAKKDVPDLGDLQTTKKVMSSASDVAEDIRRLWQIVKNVI